MKKSVYILIICLLTLTLSSCGRDIGYFREVGDVCTLEVVSESSENDERMEQSLSFTVTENSAPIYGLLLDFLDDDGMYHGSEDGREIAEINLELGYRGFEAVFCSREPFEMEYTMAMSRYGLDSDELIYVSDNEETVRTLSGDVIIKCSDGDWYAGKILVSPYAGYTIEGDFSEVAPFYEAYEPDYDTTHGETVIDNKNWDIPLTGYTQEALQYYIEQYLTEEQ